MNGLNHLEIAARKIGPSGMEFNNVSLPSYAQMKIGARGPIPVEEISNHDLFPSWAFVKELTVAGESRLLYRCAEGGFMWAHVSDDGMVSETSLVSNDEARKIYAEHLLWFTDEEQGELKETLKLLTPFTEGLKSVLGRIRVLDSFFFPDAPCPEMAGFVVRVCCVEDGGLVRATTNEEDMVISCRLIQGYEAWKILQPIIDPVEPS